MKKLARILFLGTGLLLLLTTTQLSYAEEAGNAKEIIVEAVYRMGQTDTPAKAEEQVLLRAKRNALERVSSFEFTAENIAALPPEAFAVTILDKKRSMNGDIMEFWVKIQTVVYSDKLEAAIKNEIKPTGYFRQIVRSQIGCPSYTDPHYSNAKEWVSPNAQRIEVTKFGPERKIIKIIRNDRKLSGILARTGIMKML